MEKIYYSISEIAEILQEPQHTIRYWEQQFLFLKPKKTRTGAKLYTKEQFNKFQYIHKEICENNMSVAGLKKKMKNQTDFEGKQIVLSRDEFIEMIGLFRLMFEVLTKEEV